MKTAMLLSFCLCSLVQESDSRTWSSRLGNFSTTATMVVDASDELKADVVLAKEDGKQITVPFDKLGDDSQAFVREARRSAKRKLKKTQETADANSKTESSVWNWRGPSGSGVANATGLLDQWPDSGPELLWTANGLGNAMSSLAIADGRIFTLGNRGGTEFLIALSLENGDELWASPVGNGGESNSTPAVAGKLVFGLGREGDLVCANVETGEKVWSKNFARDFGGKMMSQWGFSESPLVDGEYLICTPGGPQAMMVALNKNTGKVVWKTPMQPGGNRGTDGAGYSSPVISHGGGVKQYITLVGRGLISVEAESGKPLWQYEKIANGTANVPTPIVDGDFVFCSSGYGDGGTALLQLSGKRGNVSMREVYYYSANQLQNHHGGMIKIGDHVYMGEGHNKGFPMCVEFRTGKKTWPKQRGAGSGSAAIVAADGHLYFRYEDGTMAMIEANPNEYRLKSSFKIASHHKQSWPHPVIFDGKLYLRDQHQLHCYALSN